MKNRFCGLITVTFPDGYVEECIVKERVDKGEKRFLEVLRENIQKILEECEKGNVTVKYTGDFAREVHEGLLKVGADKRKLKITRMKRGGDHEP